MSAALSTRSPMTPTGAWSACRSPCCPASAATTTSVRPPRSSGVTGCSRRQAGSGRVTSEAGRARLAERRQPVAQSPRLLLGQPRDRRVAGGSRGVEGHPRQAEPPVERSGRDVDVLHAPVRDDGEPAYEHASSYEQVVLALGVAPSAPPSL